MMRYIKTILLLVLSYQLSAQVPLAVSLGAKVFFNCKEKATLQMNASAGLNLNWQMGGSRDYWEFRPSLNMAYTYGAIGAQTFSNGVGEGKKHGDNFFIFASLDGGFKHHSSKSNERISFDQTPHYTFGNFFTPLYYDSALFAINFQTHFIFELQSLKFGSGKNNFQRVGTGQVKYQGLNLTYSNDGTPYHIIYLADSQDKMFTGTLVLSLSHDRIFNNTLNRIELSYHKYTGYEKNNYEFSTDLLINEMFYTDEKTLYFNKGEFQVNLQGVCTTTGLNYSLGFFVRDNYRYDIQHLLHFGRYFSHHPSPNKQRWGVLGSGMYNLNPLK